MKPNPSAWTSAKWTEEEENELWRLRAIYGRYTWGEFDKVCHHGVSEPWRVNRGAMAIGMEGERKKDPVVPRLDCLTLFFV
jgi:hypothetical protein